MIGKAKEQKKTGNKPAVVSAVYDVNENIEPESERDWNVIILWHDLNVFLFFFH